MGQGSMVCHHSQGMATYVHVKVFQAKDDCTGFQVCGTVSFLCSGNRSAAVGDGMKLTVLLHLGQDTSESSFAPITFQPVSFPDLWIGQDRRSDKSVLSKPQKPCASPGVQVSSPGLFRRASVMGLAILENPSTKRR